MSGQQNIFKKTHSVVNNFPPENPAVYETM